MEGNNINKNLESIQNKNLNENNNIILQLYFILVSISALISIVYYFLLPADINNVLFLGLSLSRLVVVCVLSSFLLVFLNYLIKASFRKTISPLQKIFFLHENNYRYFLAIFLVILAISLSIIVSPGYRFYWLGKYALAIEGLRAFLVFVSFFCFLSIILLFYGKKLLNFHSLVVELKAHADTLKYSLFFWIGTTLLIWGILMSGIGIRGNWDNWYEVGVPILSMQILATAIISLLFFTLLVRAKEKLSKLSNQFSKSIRKNIDIIICVLIWALAATAWVISPRVPSYFSPEPTAPDYQNFPYSDASFFDKGGLLALIGEGVDNSNYLDHSGPIGFYAILHLIFDNNYYLIISAQVVLFSIFPVIVYSLGNLLHSRIAGMFLAGLTIIREINAIQSTGAINTISVNMQMSEYPIRIGLALLTLLLMHLLIKPKRNGHYAFPIGALLGIMILFRLNALIFPFVVIFVLIIFFNLNPKKWLIPSLKIFACMLIVLAPWMWRNWEISGNPFFFTEKISRYLSANSINYTPDLYIEKKSNIIHFQQASTQLLISPDQFENEKLYISSMDNTFFGNQLQTINDLTNKVFNHFLHNIITSVMILPTTYQNHSLEHTLREQSPFWDHSDEVWMGELTSMETVFLCINLLVLSLGLGLAWKRLKFIGLVPFGVFLMHCLSVALSGDSGGRYILAGDWFIILYYGLGVIQLILWGFLLLGRDLQFKTISQDAKFMRAGSSLFATLLLLVFVMFMVYIDQSLPQKYTDEYISKITSQYLNEDFFFAQDLDVKLLKSLNDDPNINIYIGQMIYPRFYEANIGHSGGTRSAYFSQPFSRLAFTILGSSDNLQAFISLDQPPASRLHGEEVIVIGCLIPNVWKSEKIIQVSTVIFTGKQLKAFIQNPSTPILCPITNP